MSINYGYCLFEHIVQEESLKMMLVLWLLTAIASSTLALDNGLALRPPMGWLSWLRFGCKTDCENHPKDCLSEDLIKRTADKMVSDGYRDAGYEYVVIDDCWMETNRDAKGRMVPDKKRFKGGMKALADYLHERKLKFGIYLDIGNRTCQLGPGSKGHELTDIATLVEWEVDYLKLDGCEYNRNDMDVGYPEFERKLNASGRPIVFSCSWPAYQETNHMKANYTSIAKYCNLWRNYGDINTDWKVVRSIWNWFGDNQDRLIPYAGPGHFHDPDTLIAGNPGVTGGHAFLQTAVWSMLAAPLFISADLDEIKPDTKKYLLSKLLIRVDQDELGIQGKRIYKNATMEKWVRTLSDHHYAVLIIANSSLSQNTESLDEDYTENSDVTFEELNIPSGKYAVQSIYEKEPVQTLMWKPSSIFRPKGNQNVQLYIFKLLKTEQTEQEQEETEQKEQEQEVDTGKKLT